MELALRQFCWHEQLFHGNWCAPISLTRADPWNSMEYHGTWVCQFWDYYCIVVSGDYYCICIVVSGQFRLHEQFHGIPWNSMELGMRQFRWQEQFHGIPWNLECTNFADTSSFMEFHGIPWNLECANLAEMSSSMEFHETWSAPILMTRAVPWKSMELGVHQFRWHEQFHGIPWNSTQLGVRQFRWHEQFHGTWSAPISLTRAVPWNSMEFHGTWSAPISMTRAIPWNSMELGVRQFRWHEQFHISHGIPWNLECANFAVAKLWKHVYLMIILHYELVTLPHLLDF